MPVHGDPDLPEAIVIDGPFDVSASAELAAGSSGRSRGGHASRPLLAPEPGMRVLDLCAAPGGKAGQLAALMDDRGELVCVERHAGRARALAATLDRFGASCARVVIADALEFSEGGFDRVLLDPPCSGLGRAGARPDARWRADEASAEAMADGAAADARPRADPARARRTAGVLGVHDPARRRRGSAPGETARRSRTGTAPTGSTWRLSKAEPSGRAALGLEHGLDLVRRDRP